MRLAIINDYQCLAIETASWNRLPDNVKVDVYNDQLTDAEEAALRLAPYDIVVTAREETTFNRTLVEALPNLKLLVFHGARNSALDLTALSDKGVTVCGTGYGFTNGTVELTWGLILSLVKHLPQEDAAIRSGGWGAGLPRGLTGKTLGLLGLGTLGSGVARVGLASTLTWLLRRPPLFLHPYDRAQPRRLAEEQQPILRLRYSTLLVSGVGNGPAIDEEMS